MSTEIEKIHLVYKGQLADTGRLHLYEYSRAIYAYARLIQSIEFFRREGRVPKRIVGDANTGVIIDAEKKGSFLVDASVIVSGHVIPALQGVPFKVLLSFVVDSVKKSIRGKDDKIIELAKIGLKAERERTKQSKQETERIKVFEKVIVDQSATTRQALDLLEYAMKSSSPALGRAGLSSEKMNEMKKEYQSELNRDKDMQKYEKNFNELNQEDVDSLMKKSRPLLQEIGLPLRKSAEFVEFRDGIDRKPFFRLSEAEVSTLGTISLDSNVSSIEGTIKLYDVESGRGQIRSSSDREVLYFMVSAERRVNMSILITNAMDGRPYMFSVRAFTDPAGAVTSYLLEGLRPTDRERDVLN